MFFSHSFRRSDFTYGVTKDHNVESLLCKKTFRRSEFTYGVTKDQNVESAIFDVLIVDVPTPCQLKPLQKYLISKLIKMNDEMKCQKWKTMNANFA